MSSSQCQAMIDKYQRIKSQILGLYDYLSDCDSSITACEPYMEQIEIDNEPIDKGKMAELTAAVSSFKDSFSTIVAECEKLIEYYEALKLEALAREAAEKNKPTANLAKTD